MVMLLKESSRLNEATGKKISFVLHTEHQAVSVLKKNSFNSFVWMEMIVHKVYHKL